MHSQVRKSLITGKLIQLTIRYDVIAKMETFSEDTQFTLSQAGLQGELTVEWKHRTGERQTIYCMPDSSERLAVRE